LKRLWTSAALRSNTSQKTVIFVMKSKWCWKSNISRDVWWRDEILTSHLSCLDALRFGKAPELLFVSSDLRLLQSVTATLKNRVA
jgi:hypothetical protein